MLGPTLIFLGLLHYLLLRGGMPFYGLNVEGISIFGSWVPAWFLGSFPSFVFTAVLTILEFEARNLFVTRERLKVALKWASIGFVLEILQIFPILGLAGSFDPIDVIALFTGSFFAYLNKRRRKDSFPASPSHVRNNKFQIGIFVFALIMTTATSEKKSDENEKHSVPTPSPIDDFCENIAISDSEITWTSTRSISKIGKIGIYESTIFVSDGKDGIHVIDNSDRRNPSIIGFIKIPGNIYMTTKKGIIYANAYQNLVMIDATNIPMIKNIRVIPEVFLNRADSCQKNQESAMMNYSGVDMSNVGNVSRFAIVGSYLYVIDNVKLKFIDISTPEEPKDVSEQTIVFEGESIFGSYSNIFIGSKNGLYIYDISNAGAPTFISLFTHSNACDQVKEDNDYLFISSKKSELCPENANELKIVDISNIREPQVEKVYPLTEPAGLSLNEGKLYICDGNELKTFDSSDVLQIEMQNSIKKTGCMDIIYDKSALIVTSESGITQYDISNGELEELSHLDF